VRNVMRANRARDTGPERALRRALRAAGFPGYRLNWRGAPGRPDVTYPGRRVAIFVHGCFWHRCPRCQLGLPKSNQGFWANKFELNQARDARNRTELEGRGWIVHEVWECEVRERPVEIVAGIAVDLVAARAGRMA
jgi:DNA mismatch endonuclease (patch repair protein)